jgi:hypothetical protein
MGAKALTGFEVEGAVAAFVVSGHLICYGHHIRIGHNVIDCVCLFIVCLFIHPLAFNFNFLKNDVYL